MVTNITLERLEEQVRWHSHNAKWNQDRYKWLKGVEFIAAALVPFFAGWGAYPIVTGLLAVAVVVLEAIQSIYQFQGKGITYQSTAEALKHEKYLWYATAGHYLTARNPEALLAERIEEILYSGHGRYNSEMEPMSRARVAGKQ
ncbi:MAG: DUF4231 domain-containing protein [Methanothrix sp.]|uniref:DUF4231 domain-containing protein n=2 Tax=Methanothrix sp. TaxID=90426 RepID=UPI0025FC3411|nr:DUF4231 domain-containing protein [Methanothrix sp.]MBK7385895.1 DUF4231 domain-containing protein [Methanothrix sp.]HPW72755.1 DUF4231 domain-containing protein [Methanothrix sp.]